MLRTFAFVSILRFYLFKRFVFCAFLRIRHFGAFVIFLTWFRFLARLRNLLFALAIPLGFRFLFLRLARRVFQAFVLVYLDLRRSRLIGIKYFSRSVVLL